MKFEKHNFSSQAIRAGAIIAIAIAALSGCKTRTIAGKLMPVPHIYSQTGRPVFDADLDPRLKTAYVEVIYGTDRRPEDTTPGQFSYGVKRSPSLAYGVARISALKRNGTPFEWDEMMSESDRNKRVNSVVLDLSKVDEVGRYPEDPYPAISGVGEKVRYEPSVASADRTESEKLKALVRERLSMTSQKEAIIFVHGVNTSFEDACFVMGNFYHFLGREAVPIVYSWPAGRVSGGAIRAYTRDRESSEFTTYHFKKFVRALAEVPELKKIHFMSHSRGTDVAASVLKELVLEARAAGSTGNRKFKLGKLIVAAPDIDMEVTSQKFSAEHLGRDLDRLTLYSSPNDRAIGVSEWLFNSVKRLGRLDADDLDSSQKVNWDNLPNAEFIQNKIKGDFLGHGYFHSDPASSSDLILLLRDDLKAGDPGRPLQPISKNFWRLDSDYPNLKAE